MECRSFGTWLEAKGLDGKPESSTVVASSLFSEAKQGKEEECREGVDPATHLKRDDIGLIDAPNDSRNLENPPELVVCICPGLVRRDGDAAGINDDAVDSKRQSQRHLQTGEKHQPEVSAD